MEAIISQDDGTIYASPVLAVRQRGWQTEVLAFDSAFARLKRIRGRIFLYRGSSFDGEKGAWKGCGWLLADRALFKAARSRKGAAVKDFPALAPYAQKLPLPGWLPLNRWADYVPLLGWGGDFHDFGILCVERQGEELAFRYADADETVDGVPRYFYQSDIEQFLATKAAAHTMVAYMLAAVGMDFTDVEYFYVAGAFGAYLDPKSAVTIGLYPDIPMEQIRCVGNSSLAGCRALLTDRSHLEEIGGILERMEYIQYGAIENFVDSMHAAAVIPHMNTAVYPSVERWHRERRAREGR